jgi:protease I
MSLPLKGVRAIIFLEQLYQELEVWYPYYRLKEAGAEVLMVGPEAGKSYPSKLGYPAISDRAARDIDPKSVDVAVIPGGFAPDFMRRHESVLNLANQLHEHGKILAAICHGPWLLCSTPALKGRKATCFHAIKHDVINAGADYVDAEVVVDGPIITSRKPDDMPAFMRAIFQAVRPEKV